MLFHYDRVNVIQAAMAQQVVGDFKNTLSDPDVKVCFEFSFYFLFYPSETSSVLLNFHQITIKVIIKNNLVLPYTFLCFYILYGWFAEGWEAHYPNYRHYVSCNVPRIDYPTSLARHGLTQVKVHSFAKWLNRRECGSNWDCLCRNRCLGIKFKSSYWI